MNNQQTVECIDACSVKKSNNKKISVTLTMILFIVASALLFNIGTLGEVFKKLLIAGAISWFVYLKIVEFRMEQNRDMKLADKRTISLLYAHFMTDLIMLVLTASILITRTEYSLIIASILLTGYTILEYTFNCLLYKVRDSFVEAEVLRMDQELDKEIALLLILLLGYYFWFKAPESPLSGIVIFLTIVSVLMSLFSLIKTLLTRVSVKKQHQNNTYKASDSPFDNGTLGIDLNYYCSDTQSGRYNKLEECNDTNIKFIALCYKAAYQKKANNLTGYLITLKSIQDTKIINKSKSISISQFINDVFMEITESIKVEKNISQEIKILLSDIKSLLSSIEMRDVARVVHGLNLKIEKTQLKIDKQQLNSTRGFLRILTIILYLIGIAVAVALLTDVDVFNQGNIGFGSIGLGGLYYLTKDFSTSTFAGVRIYIDDLFRVGDRLKINDLELTGVVIGFNPSTVSIRADDNSITRLYMNKIINSTFKNLSRREDKGRMITHAIKIDTNTIRIINNKKQIGALGLDKCFLLKSYFADKLQIIDNFNIKTNGAEEGATKSMKNWLHKIKVNEYDKRADEFENDCKDPLNARFITNIGAYREYLIRYLNEHNLLDNDQYIMVRYREVSPEGVTIEVRAYTERQHADRYTYEIITSEILEVMMAVIPKFGLAIFQAESSTGRMIALNKSNTSS